MSVFNVGLLLEKLYTYFLISNQTWVPQASAHIYTKNELLPFLCMMCVIMFCSICLMCACVWRGATSFTYRYKIKVFQR